MSNKKIIVTTGTKHTITVTDEERALAVAGWPGLNTTSGMPQQPGPQWHPPLAEPTLEAVPIHTEEEDEDGWIYDIDIEEVICKETEHYYGELDEREADEYLNKAIKSIIANIDLFKTGTPPTSLPDVAHIIGVTVTRRKQGKTSAGQHSSLPGYKWNGNAGMGNNLPVPYPTQTYGGVTATESRYGADMTVNGITVARANPMTENEGKHSTDRNHNGGVNKGEKSVPIIQNSNTKTDSSREILISIDQMKKIFPNGNKEALNAFVMYVNKYGKEYGLGNKLALKHFIAQTGIETEEFKSLNATENLNYSHATRIESVFPQQKYFGKKTGRKASDYLHNPSKLANVVYGGRNGNGPEASGDGWKYRGRGVLQLTGKNNYAAFGNVYNKKYHKNEDFTVHPDLLEADPELAVISGMWFFDANVIQSHEFKKEGGFNNSEKSVEHVSYLVNHGNNALAERGKLFKIADQVLGN